MDKLKMGEKSEKAHGAKCKIRLSTSKKVFILPHYNKLEEYLSYDKKNTFRSWNCV